MTMTGVNALRWILVTVAVLTVLKPVSAHAQLVLWQSIP